LGELPLQSSDAVLWLIVGALATVNMQLDLRSARQGAPRAEPSTLGFAVVKALRIIGMFALVSFFWACWNIRGFFNFVGAPATFEGGAAANGLLLLLGVVAAAALVGGLVLWTSDRLATRKWWSLPLSFHRSVLAQTCALGLLLIAALPQVAGMLGQGGAD